MVPAKTSFVISAASTHVPLTSRTLPPVSPVRADARLA
jgi:hypothetical protein